MELDYRGTKPFDSLEGKLLIASKNHAGTCFEKSIIYIFAHDENGAAGIIINNKLGSFLLEDYIQDKALKKAFKNKKVPIMYGGPVEQNKVVILTLSKQQEKNFDRLQSLTIYTESSTFLKDCVAGKVNDKFLAAKGLSAWDPNQLESEILANCWLIAPASLEILFSQRIKNKWKRITDQIGVKDFSNLVNYIGHA